MGEATACRGDRAGGVALGTDTSARQDLAIGDLVWTFIQNQQQVWGFTILLNSLGSWVAMAIGRRKRSHLV